MWVQLTKEEAKLISVNLAMMKHFEPAQILIQKIETKLNPSEHDRVQHEVFQEVASDTYHVEGDLEFDDEPVVSIGDDDGAHVMCWKWISEATVQQWVASKSI